jgi:hypothetical protein
VQPVLLHTVWLTPFLVQLGPTWHHTPALRLPWQLRFPTFAESSFTVVGLLTPHVAVESDALTVVLFTTRKARWLEHWLWLGLLTLLTELFQLVVCLLKFRCTMCATLTVALEVSAEPLVAIHPPVHDLLQL